MAIGSESKRDSQVAKDFHVYPLWVWTVWGWPFIAPETAPLIYMENFENGAKLCGSTMNLERRAISSASLIATFARYPLVTAQIVGGIHFQALRFCLKRVSVQADAVKHARELAAKNP